MTVKSISFLLFGCLALLATTEASAQYNLRTLPANPVAGQPFEVVIEEDECEEFVPSAPGHPPTFTVNGSAVSLAIDRIEVPDCGSAAVTFSVPVAGLPAGTYTLELIGRALQSPANFGSLQTVPLTVGQAVVAVPSTIPATGNAALALLVVVLVAVGWRRR